MATDPFTGAEAGQAFLFLCLVAINQDRRPGRSRSGRPGPKIGRPWAIDVDRVRRILTETLFAHRTLGALARVAEDKILADVAALNDSERQALLQGNGPLT